MPEEVIEEEPKAKAKPKTKAKSKVSDSNKATKEELLQYLTEEEYTDKILEIFNSYKTRVAINNGLSKEFRDSQKSSAIYKKLKVLLKESRSHRGGIRSSGKGGSRKRCDTVCDFPEKFHMFELISFFHNGEVGGNVHIKALDIAELSDCGNHFPLDVSADGQSERFSQSRPYRRSSEEHDFLFGVDYRAPDVGDVTLFIERAHGAGNDALSAIHAGRMRQRNVVRRTYGFGVSPVFRTYRTYRLIGAGRNAPCTHNAFAVIPSRPKPTDRR